MYFWKIFILCAIHIVHDKLYIILNSSGYYDLYKNEVFMSDYYFPLIESELWGFAK